MAAAPSHGSHRLRTTTHAVSSLLAVRRSGARSTMNRPTSAQLLSPSSIITSRPATANPAGHSSSASSSSSSFSEVISEDFLSCKICYRGLIRPRLLRCLHTFCEDCLRQHVKHVNPLRAVIECTLCHTTTRVISDGVASLQSNLLVERLGTQIIEEMEQGLPCDCCSYEGTHSDASYRCINCKDYLCEECNTIHKKTRLTRTHTIIELDGIKRMIEERQDDQSVTVKMRCNTDHLPDVLLGADNSSQDSTQSDGEDKCTHTPKLYYDETCSQLLCAACVSSENHEDHGTERVDKAARKIRQLIQLSLPEIERCFPKLNRAIDNAGLALSQSKQTTDKLRSEVKSHCDGLRQIIEDREETILNEIDKIAIMSQRTFNKLEVDSRHILYSYVVAFQFGHQLVAHGNDEEIISLKETCVPRLKHLQSAKLSESMQTTQAHLHIPAIAEETMTSICGKLITTRKIARPVLLSQMSVEMNMHQDWLSGMALNPTTGDLCLAVSSIRESRNKILIYNKGKRKTSFGIDQSAGLCLTREGNIVSVDRLGCRVKMYTIQGQLIRSFKCHSVGGVVINNEGHIVVAGSTSLHIYRRNGELLTSLADKCKGKRIDGNNGKQIITNNRSGDMIVSDPCDGSVRVYHSSGQIKFTYTCADDRTCSADGITIDKSGNILIADKNNHRINMISEQGSFRSYAVTADDGLSSPRYLCMNEEGYLMVAEQSGSIKTFQYL